MLVHCVVARAPTPLGTFPQWCAWTHSTLTPSEGCFRTSTLQGCYRCCPTRLFLGGACSCFFLLLVSASCLPLPLRSPGMSLPLLQMPRVGALGPSVLRCMSSGISLDIESTLNYAHQRCPPGLGKCYCFFVWCPQLFPSWKGAHRR